MGFVYDISALTDKNAIFVQNW